MSQDSIKILIQCEKEAKKIVNQAIEERNCMKQKAKQDGYLVIEEMKKEKEKELKELEEKATIEVGIEAQEIKLFYDREIKELENVLNDKDGLLKEIVELIVN
ncbi:hypothetical protein EDEG_03711 [Edhazardia aedis USNM 41457]|uniref:V-type proton ATPase subunit G n=1 Tax=Edhazardia aedis (strain USNM 41457) TaxID=1003232 RepID=J8ZQ32_EDHAE|nr:hypothetical protein EDEG_03711 [Edhazardia aedis USNM 41457]|eukprot:EJW01803.1 hypothetical protein EDEG_03711 [Edhazardia aedis USNM 41457]